MHRRSLWLAKERAPGVKSGCISVAWPPPAPQKGLVQADHSNLHATTRNTRFYPLLRPLLLQPSFGDKKSHPTQASLHDFLATCIDVDLEQNVKHVGCQKYTRKRGHQTRYFVRNNESSLEHCLCPMRRPVYSSMLKIVTMYPPPSNPYISETAFSHRFQKACTYHPRGNDILLH